MDYNKHYNKLIERAKNRVIDGYKEDHHIIPKCLGGDDSKENRVFLTAEEHFVAHKLLILIYPGNKKLIWAAMAMTNKTGRMSRNNKAYGWLRREFSDMVIKHNKSRVLSAESRDRMAKAKIGKKIGPRSLETRLKMSLSSKGIKKSKDHCLSLSQCRIGKKMSPHSDETKLKIKESNVRTKRYGNWNNSFLKDPIYRKNQSEKMKEIWSHRKALNNI